MFRLLSTRIFPRTATPHFAGHFLNKFGLREGYMQMQLGGHLIDPHRRTIIFLEPLCRIISDSASSRVETAQGIWKRFDEAWGALRWVVSGMKTEEGARIPSIGGYLGYELLHEIEQVPFPKEDLYHLPRALFYLYRRAVVLQEDQVSLLEFNDDEGLVPFWSAGDIEAEIREGRDATSLEPPVTARLSDAAEVSRCLSGDLSTYLDRVEQIRELIRSGEVYQVNLSQRFEVPYKEPPSVLYAAMVRATAARFAAYLYCGGSEGGDPFAIVSASPELLLASDGRMLLTSPIKGSISRQPDAARDRQQRATLAQSDKDLAELAMIVDLARNDLGRVAKAGSVRVASHARMETLPYVHHLVSDVLAERDQTRSLIEVLRSVFPGGSITGAPKIAAMRWISELEGSTRGVYTGAVGCIGGGEICQLNVAIRTGIVRDGSFIFHAGSGVVIDSDPEREYEECLTKAGGLYRSWQQASAPPQ